MPDPGLGAAAPLKGTQQQPMIDEYLAESANSAQTHDNYEWHLTKLFEWLENVSHRIDDLTPVVFKKYLASRNWQSNTEYQAKSAMCSFYKWRYGADHPALKVKVRREEANTTRTLTQDEVTKLFKSINKSSRAQMRNMVIMQLALNSGLRRGELFRLKVHDLDFDNLRLFVRIKGGRREVAIFDEITSAFLKGWLVERRAYAKLGEDALWVNLQGEFKGEPMKDEHWKIACRRWAKRAGIPHFSPHSTRRTFACEMRRNGASLDEIMKAGRWRDIDTLRRYLRAIEIEETRQYLPTYKGAGMAAATPAIGGTQQTTAVAPLVRGTVTRERIELSTY